MQHSPDWPSPTSSDSQRPTSQAHVVDLRRSWRWRAALAGVALAFCAVYLGGMLFAGRAPKAPPPDPATIQAAWQQLVSDALRAKRPPDQPMTLPTSTRSSIGLLPIRSGEP